MLACEFALVSIGCNVAYALDIYVESYGISKKLILAANLIISRRISFI
jgi:hypothetical protein